MNTDDLDNTKKCIYICGHKSLVHNRYFVVNRIVRTYCYDNDLMYESIMECIMENYMRYHQFNYVCLNAAGAEFVRIKLDMNRL